MMATYDAVIVGAGVMGASSALQLAAAGLRRVLVVEKGPGVGSGSTGRSTAIIRQTYSNYEVSLMAHEALRAFQHWADFVQLPQTRAHFVNSGVMFLFGKGEAALPQILAMHRRVGIRSSTLDDAERRRLFPDIDFSASSPELLAQGREQAHEVDVLYEHEAGFADPVGTATDLLEAARALGAEARFRARVTAIRQAGGRVTGVALEQDGLSEEIAAPVVVNCAGPWAVGLNAQAGQPLRHELVPTRVQIVTKQFSERLQGRLPMLADMVSGFYGRPEASGDLLILGSVKEEDEREAVADPDDYNDVADAPFRERTLQLLQHRVPLLGTRGRVSSYAGLYTVNRTDSHPIIDRSGLEGFFYCNGFSGHGFKLSPIVGMLVAQKVLGQWGRGKTAVPVDFFNHDRRPLTTNWGGVIA
jgi:glycine/D-amino acid oxidase-like deaminating enzyme